MTTKYKYKEGSIMKPRAYAEYYAMVWHAIDWHHAAMAARHARMPLVEIQAIQCRDACLLQARAIKRRTLRYPTA
jgi:hypothetical protein